MLDLQTAIENFAHNFFQAVEATHNESELESVRLTYLSRHGQLAGLMAMLKDLSPDQKRLWGPRLNELKEKAHAAFEHKEKLFEQQQTNRALAQKQHFDVTIAKPQLQGSLHPYTAVIESIEDICMSMGFAIVDGPEVETPFYNFEALNIPVDHPARDTHDTFWLNLPGYLLRTHTSSVQVHTMKNNKPPLALCAPGRVYRHEATDATHDFVFSQFEVLVIDKNLALTHLLGTLKVFMQALFKNRDIDIRVRPSYFPFVEPGLDVGVTCPFCKTGCSICKYKRWIELAGAGMVHPHVLTACGIDPRQWSGFAWGMGIERLAMLIYQIYDIRLFKSEKVEFLKQF